MSVASILIICLRLQFPINLRQYNASLRRPLFVHILFSANVVGFQLTIRKEKCIKWWIVSKELPLLWSLQGLNQLIFLIQFWHTRHQESWHHTAQQYQYPKVKYSSLLTTSIIKQYVWQVQQICSQYVLVIQCFWVVHAHVYHEISHQSKYANIQ